MATITAKDFKQRIAAGFRRQGRVKIEYLGRVRKMTWPTGATGLQVYLTATPRGGRPERFEATFFDARPGQPAELFVRHWGAR